MADSTTPPSRRDLKAHSVGPRLAATLAYLAGSHRASNRGLEEITEDVFDVPIALGTVANLHTEVSDALAPAHAEAVQVVRAAAVKNVDETSWKLAGTLCWLWVAATNTVAAFLIHAHRGWDASAASCWARRSGAWCAAIAGASMTGCRPSAARCAGPILKRDFQKLVDRGGAAAQLGRRLQRVAERVFVEWHLLRGGGCDRQELQRRLDSRARLGAGSQGGAAVHDSKAATFSERAGVVAGGVAVRGQRGGRADEQPRGAGAGAGVLWRKNAFGCQSEAGCRFVERMLTVVQTRRLQGRSVLDYLYDALVGSQRPPRTFSTCGRLIGYRSVMDRFGFAPEAPKPGRTIEVVPDDSMTTKVMDVRQDAGGGESIWNELSAPPGNGECRGVVRVRASKKETIFLLRWYGIQE